MVSPVPVIGLHGFMFIPGHPKHDPGGAYADMERALGQDIYGHPWQSWPPWFRSWFRGYESIYELAWDLAVKEARTVAEIIIPRVLKVAPLKEDAMKTPAGQVDLISHSLGTRVALEVVRIAPHLIRRVILLNGSDAISHATKALVASSASRFLNVRSEDDKILQALGSKFVLEAFDVPPGPKRRRAVNEERERIRRGVHGWPDLIGWQGLGKGAPAGQWREHCVEGGDHYCGYTDKRLWPMLRGFLEEA